MAKFCTNCGKRLQEDEICSCSQDASVRQGGPLGGKAVNQELAEESRTVSPRGKAQGENDQGESRQEDRFRQPGGYQQGGSYQERVYRQGGYGQSGDYQLRDRQQETYQYLGNGHPGDYRQQGSYRQDGYRRPEDQRQSDGDQYQGNYRQNAYQERDAYRQESYCQRGQAGPVNEQWMNQKKKDLIRHTQNIFAQIPALFGKPDSTMRAISELNSSVLGLEMLSIQPLLILISLLLLNGRLTSLFFGMQGLPVFRTFLLALIGTFTFGYLEAALLLAMAKAFKGKTSIHKMICVVGYKYLISGLTNLLGALMIFISPEVLTIPALLVMLIGGMASYLFFVEGYRNAVEIQPNRRLYALLSGQVLFYLVFAVIAIVLMVSVVSSIVSSLPFMSMNNYYF